MYFVRKKDLKIIGEVYENVVQFQMEDYYKNKKIKLNKKQKINGY